MELLYLSGDLPLGLPIFLAIMPFLLTYLITSFRAVKAINLVQKGKTVPTSPYWIPVFGHLIQFLWSTSSIAFLARRSFPPGPLRLRLFDQKIIFITGAENIVTVWRSKILHAREVNYFALRKFFNSPERSMRIYKEDTSGTSFEPHPKSNTPFKDRYYYHNRKIILGFFNGPGLKHMAYRFQTLLQERILQFEIGDTWVEFPDLFLFVQDLLTGPAVEAMCGPRLLSQNPEFVKQFWKLDHDILYFFKALPRWTIPAAWNNRERLLSSVKEWHTYARENFDESCVDSDGHDPCYGSPLMRRRQVCLSQIDSLDADALASQDLGLLWAENGNSIPAVFWMLIELQHRPIALSQAVDEVLSTLDGSSKPNNATLDIDKLCKQPLLQSIYAETLRLYTSLFSLRSAVHEDFWLKDWRIPQDHLIAVDSRVAHMDQSIWNTKAASQGREEYPLDRFWESRFLRRGVDSDSNKSSHEATPTLAAMKPMSDQSSTPGKNAPYFSMEGLAGAWLPYGGGSRQCPGKNFAKQEIILSFAMISTMFEIELLDEEKRGPVLPDMRYYGLGTFAPKVKVPFRIRRWQ